MSSIISEQNKLKNIQTVQNSFALAVGGAQRMRDFEGWACDVCDTGRRALQLARTHPQVFHPLRYPSAPEPLRAC
jgi:hypothetical protein